MLGLRLILHKLLELGFEKFDSVILFLVVVLKLAVHVAAEEIEVLFAFLFNCDFGLLSLARIYLCDKVSVFRPD